MENFEKNLLQRPPLYQQAADILRSRLAKMSPGECLPAERLLATEYGISITTVREAVRILAASGLVVRKQGKGTFLAERMPQKKGWVAITIDQDVSDPRTSSIYLKIAQQVRGLLEEEGVASRLYIGRNQPAQEHTDFLCPEFFQDLEAGHICGVIGVLLYGKATWVSALKNRAIDLVGFGEDKSYGVISDVRGFFVSAITELARRGKRRIALMSWQGYDNWPIHYDDFFKSVLEETGLPVVEPWIKCDLYPALKGAGWSMLREIWSARAECPDAVVVMDDFLLGDISLAVREMGIAIPSQLEIAALISHQSVSGYTFPLIAWQPNISEISSALVNLELKLLRKETPDSEVVYTSIERSPEWDQSEKDPRPDHYLVFPKQ